MGVGDQYCLSLSMTSMGHTFPTLGWEALPYTSLRSETFYIYGYKAITLPP